MSNFFNKNKDVDFIAKELQSHDECYKTFTRGFSVVLREGQLVVPDEQATQVVFQEQGDYELVRNYVEKHIFGNKTEVSMGVLHSWYGLRINDSRYRHMLKQQLMKDFPECFLFISMGKKSLELLLDSSLPLTEVNFKDKTGCIINAAEYLQEEIIEYCSGLSEWGWPTEVKELIKNERSLAANLQVFMRSTFNNYVNKAKLSESIERAVNSIALDIVVGVTQGKSLIFKKFSAGLGNAQLHWSTQASGDPEPSRALC